MNTGFPPPQGLYDPQNESDSCGIGFVANIKGQTSHDIIQRGLDVLVNMTHRGAEGSDNKTGDGCGILMQIPHDFFLKQDLALPPKGNYAPGLVFLPQDPHQAQTCKQTCETIINEEGLQVLGWRDVPRDNTVIGDIALAAEPRIEQVFVGNSKPNGDDHSAFERTLYIVRKRIENEIRNSQLSQKSFFYICTLSGQTIGYKGMLQPIQLQQYFQDLQDTTVTSAIALVHSRFSTNTFPSWDLAQPFRLLCHNGEINTVKGNRFWMQARESQLASELFGDDLSKILPVIEPNKSDSASFDNALEMLVMCGRSLPHALTMMIPESWNDKNPIPDELKAFYEYHSTFMEPWDGPASMVFTDGRYIGGTLDRNGLRPSRYVITKDHMIVMGSEMGVQTFPADRIQSKGRLMPGKILLVDTHVGRIIPDFEVKKGLTGQQPYRQWVEENRVNLEDLPVEKPAYPNLSSQKLRQQQRAFGYNTEEVENILTPMLQNGQEPTGSMGTDTPLAVLSDQPQPLFNYFKQLFAQVTNPAIDPIREELVMTLTSYIGSQQNLLAETPEHCRQVKFKNPVFTDSDVVKIKNINKPGFKSTTLPILFDATSPSPGAALEQALNKLCQQAETLVDQGYNLIILSDRESSLEQAAIPSLLACGAVHHHLIRIKKRTRVGLIVETAEAREVMHFALLFGYGAGAVNPYLALATISDGPTAEKNYIKALNKGLLKILSKMGTSTLRSYRGAQIFEAIGLGQVIVDQYFTGTDSRIGGIGLDEIARERLLFHARGYQSPITNHQPPIPPLPSEGVYRYRKDGERHAWNPETISTLQWATRTNNAEKYKEFARLVNTENQRPHVLRGFFQFKKTTPIPLDTVEPTSVIMKHFATGAMSFGSISKEAHEAMAIAMNRIGGKSNTGEGGENPERFQPRPDGTSARSAIKQIASGRFGVTNYYLTNADELQIKISQGAKPGEGGQLPGHKVNNIIAKTRYSTPGVTLISPPPHHDIYSIEDLAQLIFDLKNTNPRARISVKLVSEIGVGTIAAGVAKGYSDMILISGYDGGTGASPQSSIKHAGLPWELGLAETQQTLVLNNLRGRINLQTDGQIKTGRDVVIAALLGADEFGFSTSALIVLGCVMMRKCHLNTCPVGIATQSEELRKRYRGHADYLVNYFHFIAEEVREIMAELGIQKFDELTGRADLLEQRSDISHWKAKTLDLSRILYRCTENKIHASQHVQDQKHKIADVLDLDLIKRCALTLDKKQPVILTLPIKNTDRTTGAMLSGEISYRHGQDALPDDTIQITFQGSAGQSFGAFLVKGVTFRLEGDSNDYFGKGLSGGKLIAVPPPGSTLKPEENIIIGNTVLYGATQGEAYIRGIAGERFCVRNSGVRAVIEGAGDHCCEYMTGGRVVVLGQTGRNFAAGMSGGIAYVWNKEGNFDYFCNQGMVELTGVNDPQDIQTIKDMVSNHYNYTQSTVAKEVLDNWETNLPQFIKVMPLEYKRVLEQQKLEELEARMAQVEEDEQLVEVSDG